MGRASTLIWFVRLISNWTNPALILWLRVLLLGSTYEKGVGFVWAVKEWIWFNRHLSCLVVFTLVESREGSAGTLLRFITGEHPLFWSSDFFLRKGVGDRISSPACELLSGAWGITYGSDVFLEVLIIVLRKISGRLTELPHKCCRGCLLPGGILWGNPRGADV